MDKKTFYSKSRILFRKIWAILKEYWTDFWEGLFPTIS